MEDQANGAGVVDQGQPRWDFESILVNGLLGFGLSTALNTALLIFSIITVANSWLASLLTVIVSVLVIVMLLIMMAASEIVQRMSAKVVVDVIYGGGLVASIVLLAIGMPSIAIFTSGVTLVANATIYARMLAALPGKPLMLIIDVTLIGVSFLLLLSFQLLLWQMLIIYGCAAALTSVITLTLKRKTHYLEEFRTIDESKARTINVKGNRHTLFMMGFLLSVSMLLLNNQIVHPYVEFALCIVVGVAGVALLIIGLFDHKKIYETILKLSAFITVVFLAPLPFVDPLVGLVLVSLFLLFVCINVAIIAQAMIETVRFNQISPFWLFGKEGSIFFLGFAIGAALFSFVPPLLGPVMSEFPVIIYIAIAAVAYMQITVNYQVYPLEPVINLSAEEKARAQKIVQDADKSIGLWQRKREWASETHALSPREREVFDVLLRGRDAKYIMSKFYISQSTAKTHIYNIYKKFDVHSRQELIDYVENIELPPEAFVAAPDEDADD